MPARALHLVSFAAALLHLPGRRTAGLLATLQPLGVVLLVLLFGTSTVTAARRRQLSAPDALLSQWRDVPVAVSSILMLASAAAGGSLGWWTSVASGVVGVLLTAASVGARALLPVPELPTPRNPKSIVGTKTFTLRLGDTDRVATVQVWYPARPHKQAQRAMFWTSGHPETAAWESRTLFSALSSFIGAPWFSFGHMLLADSHTGHALPIRPHIDPLASPKTPAPGTPLRPLAIFIHGLYGFRFQNSSMCADLASEGFVVMAMDHHPDSLQAVFPRNKTAIPFSYAVPPGSSRDAERAHWIKGLNRRVSDIQALLDAVEAAAGRSPHTPTRQAADDHGAGPSFEQISRSVDTRHVAVIGHSYGGGTAMSLARRDPRVSTACGLDAWMWCVPDEDYEREHRAPVLFVSADLWSVAKAQAGWRRQMVHAAPGSVNVVLRGTGHHNFSDLAVMASRKVMEKGTKIGPLDARLGLAVVGELVLRFAQLNVPSAQADGAHLPPSLTLFASSKNGTTAAGAAAGEGTASERFCREVLKGTLLEEGLEHLADADSVFPPGG